MQQNKTAIFGLLILGLLVFGLTAKADEKTDSPVEFNGYVDLYYQQSPQAHTAVPAPAAGPSVLEGRAFDRIHNQMVLNMVELSAKKKTGKLAFRADVAFGEMVDVLSGGSSQAVTSTTAQTGATVVNPAANEPTRNITQATISYTANESLTITAGKFYTHMGYEVTKAKDNWQYSRSYTFNYAIPFWHEGVSANYAAIPGKFGATLYLLNAWDGRISQEANKSSTAGANLNFTPIDGLAANYNYIGGIETGAKNATREVHEVNVVYNLNSMLSFATDLVFGSQKKVGAVDAKWSGVAFYAKAALNDWYTLSPRYETFDDSDQGFAISGGLASVTAVKQRINALTISNNFNLCDGLETRLEYRADKSNSKDHFKKKDGTSTDHQDSYTLALLYSF